MAEMRIRPGAARLLTGAVAVTLVFGVAACAPEPGTEAGRTDKDTQTVNPETSWGDQSTPDEEAQTELPKSFPGEQFIVPDEAVIENTGERGTGQWFLVLRASDGDEAQLWWNEIIDRSGFEVSEEAETPEGGMAAALELAGLSVQGVTIPQADGTVQLSYDLQSQVG